MKKKRSAHKKSSRAEREKTATRVRSEEKRVAEEKNAGTSLQNQSPAGTKVRLPKVKRLQKRKDTEVWLVDGSYVRKNIDEEFSNFGHHFTFSAIPKNELWVDIESDPDELRFFIHHMMVERRLRIRGVDADTARMQANDAERKMRIKAGDVRHVKAGRELPQAKSVHTRLWKALSNGVQVWFVNGRLVRSVFDIEFTEGGHEHVYEFIPDNEIWIDNDIHQDERAFVLFHEMHERNMMAKGVNYDDAHEESSKLEHRYRNHPAELHEALQKEGWE